MISLTDKIFPSKVREGVVKDGDSVVFKVENRAEFDFESYVQTCGCLGTLTLSPRLLECNLDAKFEGGTVDLYTDGSRYWQAVPAGAVIKYLNVHTLQYEIDIPDTLTKVQAVRFNKFIPIYFKDGETEKVIEPSGKLKDNPLKHKADVEVTFYILK